MNKPDRKLYIEQTPKLAILLKRLFNKIPSPIIFDIGSCEGEDAVRYSRYFPNSRIFAFEPLPQNILKVEENLKNYQKKNIQLVKLALSDEAGIAEFHVSSGQPEDKVSNEWDYGNKSSSLLPPDKHLELTPYIKFDQTIKVNTETLLHFCLENNINRIDFIHMDVQGAELKVLKGAGDFIRNVGAIWLEVAKIQLYKDQPLTDDIASFMKSKGFALIKDDTNKFAGDQLFVNKSIYNYYFRFLLKGINGVQLFYNKISRYFSK